MELEEKLRGEEDRSRNLDHAKKRLEEVLNESEANFERERRERSDLEKVKRKMESFLSESQAHIEKCENVNAELEGFVKRKDMEIGSVCGELEAERANVGVAQKKVGNGIFLGSFLN